MATKRVTRKTPSRSAKRVSTTTQYDAASKTGAKISGTVRKNVVAGTKHATHGAKLTFAFIGGFTRGLFGAK